MPKTDRDIVEEALRMIGVAPLGQGVDGEDYEAASQQLSAILAEIEDIHQIDVDLPQDSYPDWSFTSLSQMVAGRVCSHFELPQFMGLHSRGLVRLRAQASAARASAQPVATEYF